MENLNLWNNANNSPDTLVMENSFKPKAKPVFPSGDKEAILNAYSAGIELMKNTAHQPSIIFIATHDNQVIEAFELNVSDNSVKHLNPARFVITNSDELIENEGSKSKIKNTKLKQALQMIRSL